MVIRVYTPTSWLFCVCLPKKVLYTKKQTNQINDAIKIAIVWIAQYGTWLNRIELEVLKWNTEEAEKQQKFVHENPFLSISFPVSLSKENKGKMLLSVRTKSILLKIYFLNLFHSKKSYLSWLSSNSSFIYLRYEDKFTSPILNLARRQTKTWACVMYLICRKIYTRFYDTCSDINFGFFYWYWQKADVSYFIDT